MTDERVSDRQMSEFLERHRLPPEFRRTAEDHYLPLVWKLPAFRPPDGAMLLAINGAQGTGKSTLADFIGLAGRSLLDWNSAILSIDDFYLTRAERRALAQEIHPLLVTRGVPGTHDTAMLADTLAGLAELSACKRMALPRFDKTVDDRAGRTVWPVVTGPLDLIVLEGWCVGSGAQPPEALRNPVNTLERDEDAGALWRTYANDRLGTDYAPLFSRFDALVHLAAPGFDTVFRWRLEQEQKLAAIASGGAAIMDEEQIARFIQFYERITRYNLETMPSRADVVLILDERHAVTDSRYRD